MEPQGDIVIAECRDGIPARIQRVPYQGRGGGVVWFGYRMHPQSPVFDANGMRNEAGDLWRLDGFWRESGIRHPFDLIGIVAGANQHYSKQYHA